MGSERTIEPLLYIEQPTLEKPVAYMQVTYEGKSSSEKKRTIQVKHEMPSGSFKNLTIREKINYLIHLPHEIPRIKCEIEVAEAEYRGIIEEENNDEIKMKVFGRGYEHIRIKDIKNIRIIGF